MRQRWAVIQSPWGVTGKTKIFLETIKFEHTIFALPFAYLTLFLVEKGWPSWDLFGWITLAMVAGRTFAMAANRLIDAEIDARNPRTAQRALPAGLISAKEVVFFMAVALVLFLVAVYQLSPLSQYLWPAVILALVAYPYAKRFTYLSHLALGLVYLMVPTGIWIALENELALASVVLGLGAGFWVVGFDIIYACQDVEVDRKQRLHSIPADMGIRVGLWMSRLSHLFFIGALVAAGIILGVGLLYYIGLGLTALLLGYEHRLVSPKDLSKVNVAFFTANGIISVVLFLLVAADTLVR